MPGYDVEGKLWTTFRHEKPVVEIHTAEPLSPISVGDYLYEVSSPDPLAVPRGHILQVAAKQHVISTQVTHIHEGLS